MTLRNLIRRFRRRRKGLYLANVDNIVVKDCHFNDNGEHGIHLR